MNAPRLLGGLAPALLLAACSAPSASITPMIGSLGLDGDFGASSSGTNVTSSFKELGIDENEAAPGLKAHLGFLGGNLSLSAFDTEFDGTGMTTGQIDIGGETISAGANVETALDLTVARGLLTWNLIPVGPVELGIGLGVSLIDFELQMDEIGTMNRLESDELVPIPLIGVRAAWTWGPVKVRAEVGGLAITIDGNETQIIDGDIEGTVRLFDGGSLAVGYRLLDLGAEYEDEGDQVEVDMELSGFYAGLRLSF